MENKMAAGAFGRARKYGWDDPFNTSNMNTMSVLVIFDFVFLFTVDIRLSMVEGLLVLVHISTFITLQQITGETPNFSTTPSQ